MRRIPCMLASCLLCVSAASAGVVRERWGPAGIHCTYPDTMKLIQRGQVRCLLFDLSALPKGTRVHHASLRNQRVAQPAEPIEIRLLEDPARPDAGKLLALEKPSFKSFDATDAVRRWVADPTRNLGLALARSETFDPDTAYLEVLYEGKPKKPPPQVTGLQAVYHDGQTFLTWTELPRFRPAPGKTCWVTKIDRRKTEVADEPGPGFHGAPRIPAIRQGELRRLQMITVIDGKKGTQQPPQLIRRKGFPDIKYRVYRSPGRITAATLQDAELVGEADALCGYDESMRKVAVSGEYYNQREVPENWIPMYCIEAGKTLAHGQAFYMYTPQEAGKSYYAVTVVKDGTENTADIGPPNSLAQPVAEKPAPIMPVLQYYQVDPRRKKSLQSKYYCWPAPPCCNLPFQKPLRVIVETPPDFSPGKTGLSIGGAGRGFLGLSIRGRFSHSGQIAYSQGLGTFLSIRQSKVDYYADRYFQYVISWVRRHHKIDPNKVMLTGLDTAWALRHPELVKLARNGSYEINFDQKWNPAMRSMFTRFGPPETAMTVDGHRAWDLVDIGWFLNHDPARDIPFFLCVHGGKESGHAIEFGWQDDPKGWAALRDARQTFVGAWGGGRISPEVYTLIYGFPFDKSVPAFSNCSLDGNCGNGDPADGDPWGQINGYLLWDPATITDRPDRWEMTVFLASDAFRQSCTVDVTPRHRRAFQPKAGAVFRWTNTDLKANKQVQSDKVTADKWGLVTLKNVLVTKDRNRLRIAKK